MNLFQLCFDAETGGGGNAGQGGGSQTTGKEAGVGADGKPKSTEGGKDDKKPLDDPNKKPDAKPTIETLQAELQRKEELILKQNQQIGTQSKTIGDFRNLEKTLKANPMDTINKIAKEAGLKIEVDSRENIVTELTKALQSNDNDALAKIVNTMQGTSSDERLMQLVDARLNPAVNVLTEQALAGKYPDYDNLADTRDLLNASRRLGAMTDTEVLHLAARGQNLADAIKDAKEEGKEELMEELRTKYGDLLEGGKRPGSEGATTKSETKKLSEVSNRLPIYPID